MLSPEAAKTKKVQISDRRVGLYLANKEARSGPQFLEQFRKGLVRINVFPVDDAEHPGVEMMVTKTVFKPMEKLLVELNRVVPVLTGPISCLFDQALHPVHNIHGLIDGECYVACTGVTPVVSKLPWRFLKRMDILLKSVDEPRHSVEKPRRKRAVYDDWRAVLAPDSVEAQMSRLEAAKRANEARLECVLVEQRCVGPGIASQRRRDSIAAARSPGARRARAQGEAQRAGLPLSGPEPSEAVAFSVSAAIAAETPAGAAASPCGADAAAAPAACPAIDAAEAVREQHEELERAAAVAGGAVAAEAGEMDE